MKDPFILYIKCIYSHNAFTQVNYLTCEFQLGAWTTTSTMKRSKYTRSFWNIHLLLHCNQMLYSYMPTFSATSLEKVELFQSFDRQLTISETSGLVKFTREINNSSHFEHSSKYPSQSAHLEPNAISKKLVPYIWKYNVN